MFKIKILKNNKCGIFDTTNNIEFIPIYITKNLTSADTHKFIIQYCMIKCGVFVNYKIAEYMFAALSFALAGVPSYWNRERTKNSLMQDFVKYICTDVYAIKNNNALAHSPIMEIINSECICREFLNLCAANV